MKGQPLSHGEWEFILAVFWCAVGFAAYYFLSNRKGNKIIRQRILGMIFLGIISGMIILILPAATWGDFGLSFSFTNPPPWWSYLLIPLILVLGFLAARTPGNLDMYPQIRNTNWTPRLLFISAISWMGFLIAYEFLFRGFLLYASLAIMNPLPAIALNCALYALAHLYKGPGETFGAIPVGIVLCYLTLVTGNIWTAVILHSIMALSNEWFSISFHPEMKFSKN